LVSILEGELAQTITDALLDADIPYDVTVWRTVPGEPDPETPWIPGEPTTTSYVGKGFTETFSADYISGGLVEANDLKVVILIPTLAITPELSDVVTVRGQTYTIISISPDPALATVALQVRA
jgi:hypothetical protein